MRPLIETPGYDKARAVTCRVYDEATRHSTLDDLEAISDILETTNAFVWLDVAQPTPDDLALLQREFAIHPMAIEDAMTDQRPKIEFFGGYVLVLAQAVTMDGDGNLVTHGIAIIAGANYVITLRAFPAYPTSEIERRRSTSPSIPNDATGLVYIILDVIVDGFFDMTDRFDDRLVRLESRLFDNERFEERTQREIFKFKRSLMLFRSAVIPMRDILARLTHPGVEPLAADLAVYFRDVFDHVMRTTEQIDVLRELVNSTFDVHLAMQSHRQNEVSKQLTIIATIFLPLTYITGFFGQNFGWMVNGIASAPIFWWLGVGSQVVTVLILIAFFRSRRWL